MHEMTRTNTERTPLVNAPSVRSGLPGTPRWVLALMAAILAAGLVLGTTQTAAAQSASASANASSGGTTYALNTSGELLGFDRSTPSQIDSRVFVSGLARGESLVGMDFRPATGELYGVGSTSALYTIDPTSGVATLVAPLSVALEGELFSTDFNPEADALRVVSDTTQNLRVDVETGEVTEDTNLAYAEGDTNAGVTPVVVDNAYANNRDGVASTALYAFDLATGNYVQQDPPDGGVLNTIGSLNPGFTGLTGFDITSLNGSDEGFAAIQTAEDQPSVLYNLDVASGAVSEIGVVGQGEFVYDLAIPTTEIEVMPDTGGLPIVFLAAVALIGGLALLAAGFYARTLVRRPSA